MNSFILEAISLAMQSIEQGGGPFGCVIVKDGEVIGRGSNQVTNSNDPTAHAEVVAIRDACARLGSFQLEGCEIYSTCEPCPMCLGAIYWARPDKVWYALSREDAASAGFDDAHIYEEIELKPEGRHIPFCKLSGVGAEGIFEAWEKKADKTRY